MSDESSVPASAAVLAERPQCSVDSERVLAQVLAKKKSTGDYFAMKKLKKSHMVRKKQVEHLAIARFN